MARVQKRKKKGFILQTFKNNSLIWGSGAGLPIIRLWLKQWILLTALWSHGAFSGGHIRGAEIILGMLLWAFRISVVVVVFFLSVFPGVEFLIFWEASILFSIVAASIYIPLQPSMKIPLSLHPWQDLLCSLWWQSFWQVWSDISLWFWFPWW